MKDRQPNHRLRALLAEAGLTHQALATDVNRLGGELGRTLHYDRTSVAHWLTGTRPRPPVPGLIAEALARRLGRPVTESETGLGGPPAAPLPSLDADTVPLMVDLCRSDNDPGLRRALLGTAFQLDRPQVVEWSGLCPPARGARTVPTSTSAWPRIGRTELDLLDRMTTVFATTTDITGGGALRGVLTSYLADVVSVWLTARANEEVHRGILTGAARLAYLHAGMCVDGLAHGLAQRYYHAALRLTHEAEDPGTYATILRAMSSQAKLLGHHEQALHAAEAAVASAPADAPRATRTFLLTQLAVALADTEAARDARAVMTRAERVWDKSAARDEPFCSYPGSALTYQRARVFFALGERDAAIAALRTSLRKRPPEEHRARALTLAALGLLTLRQGHLEQSCAVWTSFLDELPHLRSARVDGTLFNARSELLSYSRNPEVSSVLEQIRHTIAQRREGAA